MQGSPQHPVDEVALARRRATVAELYLDGHTQAEIAAQVGVCAMTVSRDIKAIHGQWLASSLLDVNEAKVRELARIDHLERTYWRAWRESRKRRLVKTEESGDRGRKTSVRKEKRTGSAAYLQGIQWCINKRCEILGLDAPRKQETVATVHRPYKDVVARMPKEELLEIKARLDRHRQLLQGPGEGTIGSN